MATGIKTRLGIAGVAVGLLLALLVAPTASAAIDRGAAKRAVKRVVNQRYDMSSLDVRCTLLSNKLATCEFAGLTRTDIREGNVDGHSGTARVRKYPFELDVRITSYGYGGFPDF